LPRNVDAGRNRSSFVRIAPQFALPSFDSLSNMDNKRDSRKVVLIDMGMRHRMLSRQIRDDRGRRERDSLRRAVLELAE
jgi:hypothetical protein